MTAPTILLADDDGAIRTVVSQALCRAGFEVKAASNAATLWRWVSDGDGDLVITDVVMPDENGLDLIPRIRSIRPELRIIVMSAQNTLLTAVKATECGAFEYLPKPFDIDKLVSVVKRGLETPHANGDFRPEEAEESLPLIGRSPVMQDIYRTLARLMSSDLTVMINGESGTGKELVAHALHDYGKRKDGPFIAINMAAIPKELIESELFGHEKGAFTGAQTRQAGRFEQAEGGTLFLDEIGDTSPGLQKKLLRVIQERVLRRVGGQESIEIDVRIVSATNKDLSNAVREGDFREDLYYRLNVINVHLPALRDRGDDIELLAQHFLKQINEETGSDLSLNPELLEALRCHEWPGNIRELQNEIRRVHTIAEEKLDPSHLSARVTGEKPMAPVTTGFDRVRKAGSLKDAIEHLEAEWIEQALERCDGHRGRVCQWLGIPKTTLYAKMRRYGLSTD